MSFQPVRLLWYRKLMEQEEDLDWIIPFSPNLLYEKYMFGLLNLAINYVGIIDSVYVIMAETTS